MRDKDIPGLAMTRSMADSCGAQVGVIGVPEIKEYQIRSREDKLVIIASDGVWEFVSNEDAGQILLPFADPKPDSKTTEGAGEALVKHSYMQWRKKGENQIDDITSVVLFLK